MKTGEFVAVENVKRFRRELENGDGARHTTLLKLLVEEENRLGLTYEQLSEVDRQIARINSIIRQQLEIIGTLKAHGHPVEQAERALARAIDLRSVHQAHRHKIEAALAPAADSRKYSHT